MNRNIIIHFEHVLPEMIFGHLAAHCIKCFQELLRLKMPVNGSSSRESLLEILDSPTIFQMKPEILLISCW